MIIRGVEDALPEELSRRLRAAKSCVVLTGAGISAESGVPTFRDAEEGLWSTFNLEELATPEGFMRDPKKVWEWYQHRRETIRDVKPNPGHYALAGSKKMLELHGNIHRNKCFEEGTIIKELPGGDESPPRCPDCHGLIRPDVVWFNELLPEYELSRANEVSSQCEVFISAGTSAIVYPAADLPLVAKRGGAYVVEVNVEETAISGYVDVTIIGKTGTVLPRLARLFGGE